MARPDNEYEHAEIEVHRTPPSATVILTTPHEQHPTIPTQNLRHASANIENERRRNTNPFQTHSKISIIPENRRGELNIGYLATFPGALKLAEIVGLNDLF